MEKKESSRQNFTTLQWPVKVQLQDVIIRCYW